jgi:hypothetical protein
MWLLGPILTSDTHVVARAYPDIGYPDVDARPILASTIHTLISATKWGAFRSNSWRSVRYRSTQSRGLHFTCTLSLMVVSRDGGVWGLEWRGERDAKIESSCSLSARAAAASTSVRYWWKSFQALVGRTLFHRRPPTTTDGRGSCTPSGCSELGRLQASARAPYRGAAVASQSCSARRVVQHAETSDDVRTNLVAHVSTPPTVEPIRQNCIRHPQLSRHTIGPRHATSRHTRQSRHATPPH